MNMSSSTNKDIENSLKWLKEHPEAENFFGVWIGHGDSINYAIHRGKIPHCHSDAPNAIQKILEDADFRFKEDVLFYRETSFPNKITPTLTSVTSKREASGEFGDNKYPILVPKGTKFFFISASDILAGVPLEETEEEFLLEHGSHILVDGRLVYKVSN